MIITQYTVTIEDPDWSSAHFELRIGDHERPFHIVLRRAAGLIGLNSMAGGQWGQERQVPLPDFGTAAPSLIIEAVNEQVHVLIADEVLRFDMGVSQADVTLHAAAANMSWSVAQGSGTRPPLHLLRQDAESGRLTEIDICGRTLDLPDAATPADRTALVRAMWHDNGSYLQFAASRPLTGPDGDLLILDIDPSAFFALSAAILFPGARICWLAPDRRTGQWVGEMAQRNGLATLEIAGRDEIAGHLADAEGSVLLQGGQAFDLLGPELDALSGPRRAQLSIRSDAKDIIPGNRVLPCANAQILVSPYWEFNRNAAIELSGRRPGLDIAVAAYNAKAYLIECVESLLCDGRDDVRVIVVDDGSTDGSGEMVAAHFASDARVRVERKPNGGCASARNYGRLVSDATHIAFVDADDFVTPGFFADLYDLALYSGCEITRGGFDFYDETRDEPYYNSYEENILKDVPSDTFKGQRVIRLQAQEIIKGQPSIWRKVYRRAFLNAKNIYFPENVRAFDDYIFQLFALNAARDILMLPDHKYHYRQHPAQDIKQGDERHFYMIYMFHLLLKRSVAEGWPDFRPYAESMIDSIAWSTRSLRPDLTDSFLRASARICVAAARTYGPEVMAGLLRRVGHPDFLHHYRAEYAKAKDLPDGVFWSRINGELYHPDVLHMRTSLKKAF